MSLTKATHTYIVQNHIGRMEGKTVLITGANSGVGYKSAELLVTLGAHVIMACRNTEKAECAKKDLLAEYPDAEITVMQLDIADFSSIDAFVREVRTQKIDIDVFVNNAGVFHKPNQVTKDGFELVLGTNYFGVYYLTKKIFPYLRSLPHRVIYVNTVSLIHKIATIDYEDFYYRNHYNNFMVYARSKLSLMKFTYALAQKYKDTNVCVVMNHPGIAITQMGLDAYGDKVGRAAELLSGVFNSPEKSALSILYILSRDVKAGSIIGPNMLLGGWGYPADNHVYKKVKTGAKTLIRFTEREIATHS